MAIMVGRSLSFSRGKHARFTSANAVIKGTLERSAALNANIYSLDPVLIQQTTLQFNPSSLTAVFPSNFTPGNTIVKVGMGSYSETLLGVPPMAVQSNGYVAGGGNRVTIEYIQNLQAGVNYLSYDGYWASVHATFWFGEFSGLVSSGDIRELGSGDGGGPQTNTGTVSPYTKTSSVSTSYIKELVVVAVGRAGWGSMSAASGWTQVADLDGLVNSDAQGHIGVYTQVVPSGTTPSFSATGASASWGLMMLGLKAT